MKETFLVLVLLFIFHCCFGQQPKTKEKDINQKIDNYIKEVIEVNEIPGAALAVIKDGKVIYEKYYGEISLEEKKAVDKNTSFKIFSTSKLITNVGIFQLIESKKLSLEDPIAKYLDNLPKEWQEIKVKNLLTHSSGLPNIAEFEDTDIPITLSYDEKIARLAKKPMDFKTADQYRYNQTNYLFLTKIIEKITGLSFDEYIAKNQFSDTKEGVYFSSNSGDIFPNGGIRYFYNTETKKYKRAINNNGIDAHSANGLNISLSEFIRWNEKLDKNIFLKNETKNSMWEPFRYTNDATIFGYGWDIYPLNNVLTYGFTGGNETAFRKFPKSDMTIIFLSNGHKYSNLYVQSKVINHVAGIVDKSLVDEYFLADEKITLDFLKLDIAKSVQNYLAVKKNHPDWNFENRLNVIGYTLMKYRTIDDAIKVFELNANENPKSGNAFDSLADGYFNNNQLEISKQYYQKSLALSPENTNAKEMLKKIDTLLLK